MMTLRRALRSLAVTVVVLGALEVVCALLLHTRDQLPPDSSPDGAAWPMPPGKSDIPIVRDAALLWRNEPRARRILPRSSQPLHHHDTWTVALNSEGFRGPERSPSQGGGQGIYRILCIGDSVTFGYDVDQDATFPRRLEGRLRQRHPGRPIEVINVGVPGWSWVQGLRFLEREGLALRPNLVLAAHGADDQLAVARITDSEQIWLLSHPRFRLADEASALHQQSAAYRVASGSPKRIVDDPSPGCTAQMRSGGTCHRVSPDEIEGTVHAMRRLTEAAGVDLVIMNVDFLGAGVATSTAARRAAWRDKIPFSDQVAGFRKLAIGEQMVRSHELGVAVARVPTIRLRAPDPVLPPRAQRVLLRVLVASPASRVTARGITMTGEDASAGREPFNAPMYDDGTHGDERPHDAVFSATVHVPDVARVLRYRFYLDGSPEFVAAPSYPDAWTERVLRFADDVVAPVELFGERFLMADEGHPDATGQHIIATTLANAIDRLPAFREFADGSLSEQ